MKHKRINRGKERKYLKTTQDHIADLNVFRRNLERLAWKWFKKAYCPKCKVLTVWDTRQINLPFADLNVQKHTIVGFIKECSKCNLQMRTGIDKMADYYIGGMFEKDL